MSEDSPSPEDLARWTERGRKQERLENAIRKRTSFGPFEKRVFDCIAENEGLTNGEIRKRLIPKVLNSGPVSNVLRVLISKGSIERDGQHKQRRYYLAAKEEKSE